MNINVHKVIDTELKPFGFNRFYPGPGVGDIVFHRSNFLKWSAKKKGVN